MFLLRTGLLTILCVGLTGCAAVAPFTSAITGDMSPPTGMEINTQNAETFQEAKFKTNRTNPKGSSRGFKLLGFITLYPATVNQALDRLYMDAQAQQGRPQTLAHLIVEHSGIYVILFSIPKVTARADLIEFVPLPKAPGVAKPEGEIP